MRTCAWLFGGQPTGEVLLGRGCDAPSATGEVLGVRPGSDPCEKAQSMLQQKGPPRTGREAHGEPGTRSLMKRGYGSSPTKRALQAPNKWNANNLYAVTREDTPETLWVTAR
ncbi:hypothetical protein NDU88_008572 [Pleurodeles waltl]|uniref:Uncharacterized protein n=1 Tax=Pleurodeles waltl TaxID=8319 RepID=A0AAV7PPV4_PLEWA|nr:hypothetical protein NDU88_008572 [Pleurodeles waltl]